MKQNPLVGLDPQTPKSTQKPNLPDPANVMGDWGTLMSRETSFFCMEISNLKASGFCHQDEIVVSPTLIIQGPQPFYIETRNLVPQKLQIATTMWTEFLPGIQVSSCSVEF